MQMLSELKRIPVTGYQKADPAETLGMEWTPQDIAQMEQEYFKDKNKGIIYARAHDPVQRRVRKRTNAALPRGAKKENDRGYVSAGPMIKRGAKATGEELDLSEFRPQINHSEYVGTPEYEHISVDPAELQKRGFVFVDNPNRPGIAHLRMKKGDEVFRLERNEEGQWELLKPTDQITSQAGNLQASPIVMRGKVYRDPVHRGIQRAIGAHTTGTKEETPADPQITKGILDQWQRDPESFGDSITKNGVPESIEKAAANGLFRATQTLKSQNRNVSSAEVLAQMGEFRGLYGMAYEAMHQILGGWKFKFGDPSIQFNKEVKTDIYSLLRDLSGIEDRQQAQEIIKKFNDMVEQEIEPSPNDFPHGVYEAFLKNGFYWRASEAGSKVAGMIVGEFNRKNREQAGLQGASDSETGDTKALVGGDIADTKGLTPDEIAMRKELGADAGDADDYQSKGMGSMRSVGDIDKSQVQAGRMSQKRSRGEETRAGVTGTEEIAGLQKERSLLEKMGQLATVFNTQALKENPDRKPGSVYQHRYNLIKRNAIQKLVGGDPATALANALDVARSNQPEEERAALDAIGDVAAGQIVKLTHQKALMPNDENALVGLLDRFFVPGSGEHDLSQIAQQFGASLQGPINDVLRFVHDQRGNEDFTRLITSIRDSRTKKTLPTKQQPGMPTQQKQAPAAPPVSQGAGGYSYGGEGTQAKAPLRMGAETWKNEDDFERAYLAARHTPAKQQQMQQAAMASRDPAYIDIVQGGKREHTGMITFAQWRKLREMAGTGAVYDGSKPTTFNYWGAVGLPGGKVIDGEVPVKKQKRKKHARSKQ